MKDSLRERIDSAYLAYYDASPGLDFDNLEEFVDKTKALELAALQPDPAVETSERMIPSPSADAPQMKLRIYRPTGSEGGAPLPCLLYFHGGGFLFGTVYRQESLCQRYVKDVGCVVVSVEYRLAPQWKAPAPVEDAYAALCYVASEAAELGIDPKRLAACGISAGGTIAAALSLYTRDHGGPALCLQLPLYAELDWRMESPSCREITSHKVWCFENNETSWDLYLGEDRAVSYYDSPALCEDLSGLPPLFSYVGMLDPVRDENITYWQRLMQQGVSVECHVLPGVYHCFELGTPDAEKSRTVYALTAAALRRAFGL